MGTVISMSWWQGGLGAVLRVGRGSMVGGGCNFVGGWMKNWQDLAEFGRIWQIWQNSVEFRP